MRGGQRGWRCRHAHRESVGQVDRDHNGRMYAYTHMQTHTTRHGRKRTGQLTVWSDLTSNFGACPRRVRSTRSSSPTTFGTIPRFRIDALSAPFVRGGCTHFQSPAHSCVRSRRPRRRTRHPWTVARGPLPASQIARGRGNSYMSTRPGLCWVVLGCAVWMWVRGYVVATVWKVPLDDDARIVTRCASSMDHSVAPAATPTRAAFDMVARAFRRLVLVLLTGARNYLTSNGLAHG